MTVKVKNIQVRVGDKTYFPGDSISGLTKKEEKRLVSAGHCEYVSDISDSTKSETSGSETPDSGATDPKTPDSGAPDPGTFHGV